jgi:hypothetical protein
MRDCRAEGDMEFSLAIDLAISMVFSWVDAWSQQFQAETVMTQNELACT